MSVASTLHQLAEVLLAAELTDADLAPDYPAMDRRPRAVIVGPREQVHLGDFPCGLLTLAPMRDHSLLEEAVGLARHDYAITLYWFVGARELTSLLELYDRAQRWIEPIGRELYAHLTLNGTVAFVGGGDADNTLLTYQIGPMDWGDGKYFGLRFTIPITEKYTTPMEP